MVRAVLADPFAPTSLLAVALASPSLSSRRPLPQKRKSSSAELEFSDLSYGALSAATEEGKHSPGGESLEDGGEIPGPKASEATSSAASEETVLSAEELSVLSALRAILHDAKLSEEVRSSRARPGLSRLFSLSGAAEMAAGCAALDAETMPEEALLCACHAACQPEVGGRAAGAFARAALAPRVGRLDRAASRTLFGALLGMMRVHGKAILAEVVVPTLCRAELSAGQLEALQRLLKEAPADGLGTALGAYLAADGGVPASWSDAQASVLQTLLARKPALDERTLADLVLHIDANGHAGAKSLKFANLLNTVVRGYAQQLRPHVAILQRVADTLETFMKKGILAALGKLAAVPADRES